MKNSSSTRRKVVQSYRRLGEGATPENPYPTINAGAAAIEGGVDLAGDEGAETLHGGAGGDALAVGRPDLARLAVNEVLGVGESMFQPLTRSSELLNRADPHRLLDILPQVRGFRGLGDGVSSSWDWYHQRGYEPGLYGQVAGDAALLRLAPPIAAYSGIVDERLPSGQLLNRGADQLGAVENSIMDYLHGRFGQAGRAGLRGRQQP